MLEAKGRVSLSTGIHAWVERALDAPGVTLAGISPAIALDASRLLGASHGDPADRILIATARQHGARLATRDRAILDYARTGALLWKTQLGAAINSGPISYRVGTRQYVSIVSGLSLFVFALDE